MLIFKLINTLETTEEDEWEKLASKVLGPGVHPDRARGFGLAREALRQCYSENNIHLSVKDLILEDFGKVKDQDSLTISLSHTSKWGAAVVADTKLFKSVGIDIEPLERNVKPAILERISHPEDCPQSPIVRWALKEACFKALMNTRNFERNVEFSSLKINEKNWIHSHSHTEGEWELHEQDKMIIALAWIRN